jgi:hypothetical protein
MPVVITPSSELGKELRKWEQHHTQYSLTEDGNSQPGNPYQYRPYPKMLYKAHQRPNGQPGCMLPPPYAFEFASMDQYERACLEIEAFNKTCYTVVHDESQERIARGQGWATDPKGALDLFEQAQQAIAQAAAEAAFAARRMSESAQQEFSEAEASTSEHVTDVTKGRAGKKARGISATETE